MNDFGLIENILLKTIAVTVTKPRNLHTLSYSLFVMYYMYGCVWAIPTYRVYRLNDNFWYSRQLLPSRKTHNMLVLIPTEKFRMSIKYVWSVEKYHQRVLIRHL